MNKLSVFGLMGALALGACETPPPSEPLVTALPGANKDYARFQGEDVACRQQAAALTGNPAPAVPPGAAGGPIARSGDSVAPLGGSGTAPLGGTASSGVSATPLAPPGSAPSGAETTVRTAGVPSASPVPLPPPPAALLTADNASLSPARLQQKYDIAYTQCMYSFGNQVTVPPYQIVELGGYPYGYDPFFDGPFLGGPFIGFGFAGGYYHRGYGGFHGGHEFHGDHGFHGGYHH